jgi:hypothetical protein
MGLPKRRRTRRHVSETIMKSTPFVAVGWAGSWLASGGSLGVKQMMNGSSHKRREGEGDDQQGTSLVRTIISPGHVVLLGLMGLGLAVATGRYISGIGAISNLSDSYPWGLWISFDLLCGVALAAGAFVTASAVYILGNEDLRPVLRPAILTGFLGYLMVVFALLVDLGHRSASGI